MVFFHNYSFYIVFFLSNSTVLKVMKGLPWRIGVAKDDEKTAKSMRKDSKLCMCPSLLQWPPSIFSAMLIFNFAGLWRRTNV